MLSKLCEGINKKWAAITSVAVFVFLFISDFIIHGKILKQAYEDTDYIWRGETEMQDYFLWMLLGQFLLAKFFTLIYAKGYQGGGVSEALRYAFFIAPLTLAPNFVQYSVLPMPSSLLWAWNGFGVIQIIGAAIIAGLIYKK